jgi:phosphotransferase system enzyme I (PtsP)
MTDGRTLQAPDYHLRIIQEISDLVNLSTNLEEILYGIVNRIASSLGLDVVSVYLWDEGRGQLVLRANHGLQVDPSEPITLRTGEGLTGLVLESRRTLAVSPASQHPRFRHFPQSGESKFDNYLGVPILLQGKALGVLVAQSCGRRRITPAEQTLLEVIASRLAGLLEVADRLERLKGPGPPGELVAHQGRGLSPGYAVGPVYLYRGLFKEAPVGQFDFDSEQAQVARLEEAIASTGTDLEGVIDTLRDHGLSQSEMGIFQALLQILRDETFRAEIVEIIRRNEFAAEYAVIEAAEAMARQFEGHPERYLRERAQDFRDIGERVLHHLLEQRGQRPGHMAPPEGAVLVAYDVGPSLLALLYRRQVKGVVTEQGGATSHTAILAQSLGIPAVAGIPDLCNMVRPGQRMLIDGKTGFVFLNPGPGLVKEYEQNFWRLQAIRREIEQDPHIQDGPCGMGVNLSANIGFPADVEMARHYGLRDVGLFRTEFTFMRYDHWPTAAEQEDVYLEVAQGFAGEITIRALDIGGDKFLPYFNFPREENPLLGLRSIRFSMEYLDLFRDQIRAILAGFQRGARFRILLPMVSNIWEVETAWQIIERVGAELGLDEQSLPPLGMMMEVPAILFQLADYADMVDFISIGTNDLVQYLLAVDRNSNLVGHLYSGFHPAVLRTLWDVLAEAGTLGKEVSVCGELAGTPAGALALLAIGFRRLSVLPSRAPVLRYLCRRIDHHLLKRVKQHILSENKEAEIHRYLCDVLEDIDPLLTTVE